MNPPGSNIANIHASHCARTARACFVQLLLDRHGQSAPLWLVYMCRKLNHDERHQCHSSALQRLFFSVANVVDTRRLSACAMRLQTWKTGGGWFIGTGTSRKPHAIRLTRLVCGVVCKGDQRRDLECGRGTEASNTMQSPSVVTPHSLQTIERRWWPGSSSTIDSLRIRHV